MARTEYGSHTPLTGSNNPAYQVSKTTWESNIHKQQGIIGYDGTTSVLSSDAFTLSDALHVISAQTGTSDDLAIIISTDAALHDEVRLKSTSGHTITVKHGIGNILLKNGQDVVLDSNREMILQYDGTKWREILSTDKIADGASTIVEVVDY